MSVAHAASVRADGSLMERLNSSQHELALRVFMMIVLAHWGEHLLQGFQIYALGWPIPEARGVVGYFFPWVIQSETLHYGYALVMLIGLWTLRGGFTGIDRRWWTIALAIQFFHHFEHVLLIAQATTGRRIPSVRGSRWPNARRGRWPTSRHCDDFARRNGSNVTQPTWA